MTTTKDKDFKVKSLAKAMNLLECFTTATPELGISELARMLGCGKSNAHNIVSTFLDLGYLRKLPNDKYCLGYRLLPYTYVINQHLGYPNAVYDILLDIAEKTQQLVYFAIPYETDALYLYVMHPPIRLRELPYREIVGERAPLYCTGIGKAMLAFMPEDEWDAHIPENLHRFTAHTIMDRELLIKDLKKTRERGYSIDNMEREHHVRCVGMPIYNSQGLLVAGASVSGPEEVMTDEKLLECMHTLSKGVKLMQTRIYA